MGGKMEKQELQQAISEQLEQQTQARNLLTVKQFTQKYKFLSESALRALIFRRNQNGFSKVIKRINKKILIDVDLFFLFIEEQSK